jgi:large subunit ribosomal protein L23
VVTEKATNLAGISKYAFRVSNDANKIEVARAIYHVYGVKPLAINMICMRGKNVRHGRTSGKTKNWKKAIVTLKPGDKIEIYEGV